MTTEVSPNTWRLVKLKEIASQIQYGYTAKAKGAVTGPRFLRITDIQEDAVDWANVPSCDIPEKEKGKYLLRAGDIVFARTGATVGKSYLVGGTVPESVFASYLIRVRLKKEIEPKYISYFFRSPSYWHQISENQAGIGQPNVNGSKLADLEIPLPPTFDDQRCIVAEIEKQFSRLDEAVSSLRRIQANLKRYKAVVLKVAVEGKLTEQWRKEHPDVEPADQLLKRILTERRAKWEAEELAKMKAKGIKPKDDSWKKKYKEPVGPDTANFPELPEGWTWTSFEQLLCFLRNGISAKPDADAGLPILRISAVRPMLVKLDDVRYLPSDMDEYLDYALSAGDLLFTRYNGNPDLVGVCGVVPILSTMIVHPDKLIRCKLVSNQSIPKFVAHTANIGSSRNYLAQRVRTTAGQAGISGADLRGMPIPLPPHAEQEAILEELDRRLSVTEELETTVETSLKRAECLRKKILVNAFILSRIPGKLLGEQ